jgi:elongation factor Ts
MAVEATKVKELREKTGLPMMECKKALEQSGGDVDKAYEELRKSGLKAQEKLAGRTADDGRVGSHISRDGKVGVLVALCCETEPVAKNEDFQKLLQDIVGVVAEKNPADLDALKALELPAGHTVQEGVTELVNKIRENITLGRFARFEADAVVQYVHFDNKKGAMVALKGGSIADAKVAEVGKDLGMHIVFSKPTALSRDKLDPKVVDKEREILLAAAKNDPKNAKKPAEILEKIIKGQVEKFVAAQCFLEQPFVKDEKQSVEKYVKGSGTGVTVVDFAYVATDQD